MAFKVPVGISPSAIHSLMLQPGAAGGLSLASTIELLKSKAGTPYDCPLCAKKGKITVPASTDAMIDSAPAPTEEHNCYVCGGFGYTRYKLVYHAIQKRYVLDESDIFPPGLPDTHFTIPSGMIPDNFQFLITQALGGITGATTLAGLIVILKAQAGTAFECKKCSHTGEIQANPADEADPAKKSCDLCGRWGYTLLDHTYDEATDTYTPVDFPEVVPVEQEVMEPL